MSPKGRMKGIGKEPTLGQLGSRLVHTVLREERLAEKNLEKKLQHINGQEHKAMVRLSAHSLDTLFDIGSIQKRSPSPSRRPHTAEYGLENRSSLRANSTSVDTSTEKRTKESSIRSSPPRQGLIGRKAVSVVNYDNEKVNAIPLQRSFSEGLPKCSSANGGPVSPTIILGDEEGNEDIFTDEDMSSSDNLRKQSEEGVLCSAKAGTESSKLVPHSSSSTRRRGSAPEIGLAQQNLLQLGSPMLLRRSAVSDTKPNPLATDQNETKTEEIILSSPSTPESSKNAWSSSLGPMKIPGKPTTPPSRQILDGNLPPDAGKPNRPTLAARTLSTPTGVGGGETSVLEVPQSPSSRRYNGSRSSSSARRASELQAITRLQEIKLQAFDRSRRVSMPPRIDASELGCLSPHSPSSASRSPSPSRRASELQIPNLTRRGSTPPRIDASELGCLSPQSLSSIKGRSTSPSRRSSVNLTRRGSTPPRIDSSGLSCLSPQSPSSAKSRSPSPSRRSCSVNLTRIGSMPPPLRNNLFIGDDIIYRSEPLQQKRLSAKDEDLNNRVEEFLKSFPKKE